MTEEARDEIVAELKSLHRWLKIEYVPTVRGDEWDEIARAIQNRAFALARGAPSVLDERDARITQLQRRTAELERELEKIPEEVAKFRKIVRAIKMDMWRHGHLIESSVVISRLMEKLGIKNDGRREEDTGSTAAG